MILGVPMLKYISKTRKSHNHKTKTPKEEGEKTTRNSISLTHPPHSTDIRYPSGQHSGKIRRYDKQQIQTQ